MSNKMKRKRNQVWQMIGHHSVVVLRGLVKVLYGTATAGLMGLAVYGFLAIGRESGWTAVCDFIVAILTMIVALISVYVFGCRGKQGRG